MNTADYLVVELPNADTLFTRFTAQNPRTTVDLITEPVHTESGEKYHPSVFMVKGASAEALRRLEASVARTYGFPITLHRDERRAVWVGRLRIRESRITDPGARALLGFQDLYGVKWTHIEDGVFHWRARLEEGVDPTRLVDQVKRYFAAAGIDAHIDTLEMPTHDLGVWQELVERWVGVIS